MQSGFNTEITHVSFQTSDVITHSESYACGGGVCLNQRVDHSFINSTI